MPKDLFNELDKEKRERITLSALKEFATYGYVNGSTNRIVKDCGISKGSLFKYFENKEELYFYLIDIIFLQMAEEISVDPGRLSKDLFERVIEYASTEISWYISNPLQGKFMIGIASENDPEIVKKTAERYEKKSMDIYEELLKGADMSCFKNSRREITDILKWVLGGFNNSFLLKTKDSNKDIDRLKREYIKQLKTHLQVLKNGL